MLDRVKSWTKNPRGGGKKGEEKPSNADAKKGPGESVKMDHVVRDVGAWAHQGFDAMDGFWQEILSNPHLRAGLVYLLYMIVYTVVVLGSKSGTFNNSLP